LRLERTESSRLAWAFAFSLAVHLLLYGCYQVGKKIDWQSVLLPPWLQPVQKLAQLLKKKPAEQPRRSQEIPLLFVDVSPAQAVTEPPKESKYYSDKNSKAANPEPKKEADAPQITGTQQQIAKTEDVPREKFTPLQPSPPPTPVQPAKEAQEEMKPKATYTPGDLTLAKPDVTLRKDTGEETHARPRTVQEALAQKAKDHLLPGEKMKQDGGVRRAQVIPSLDVRATPFGDYDRALIDAVSSRWYALLDERDYASDSRGKVVLNFTLHSNGRVTDVKSAENTTGVGVLEVLCRMAVEDPAPFAPWPSEMRHLMDADVRNIQFTFYYY